MDASQRCVGLCVCLVVVSTSWFPPVGWAETGFSWFGERWVGRHCWHTNTLSLSLPSLARPAEQRQLKLTKLNHKQIFGTVWHLGKWSANCCCIMEWDSNELCFFGSAAHSVEIFTLSLAKDVLKKGMGLLIEISNKILRSLISGILNISICALLGYSSCYYFSSVDCWLGADCWFSSSLEHKLHVGLKELLRGV